MSKFQTPTSTTGTLVVTLTCQACGEGFPFSPQTYDTLGLRAMPKSCPHCLDEKQKRPAEATTVSRRCVMEFPAVAIHLPVELFLPYTAGGKDDRPCLRAVVKGSSLSGSWQGKSWEGRVDIYTVGTTIPSVARLRVMEVTHAQGHKRVESHGSPMGPKTEVQVSYPDAYTYLSLEPSEETQATVALILARVDYKTTLKGMGRQWHADLDSSQALWAVKLSNSARSGRFGNYGAVAVVDDEHPVITRQWGDMESHRHWTLSHPGGEEI